MGTRRREPQGSSTPFERVGTAAQQLQFRRAQMHLGTLVSISIGGMSEADCTEAARRGFAAVATIHDLMSFHEPGSDVDRLNCRALEESVEVDPLTIDVLRCALDISAASSGAFDISIAGELVERGVLPRPRVAHDPEPGSSWRDIELCDNQVRFHRPLWIDLGGIAKGFAVDYAFEMMDLERDVQLCVDAGGDLRVQGEGDHPIRLCVGPDAGRIPILLVHEAMSVASSSGADGAAAHIHGVQRTTMGERSFVTVMSKQCMIADALTKVAMAAPDESQEVFSKFGATALINASGRFSTIGVRG